MYCNRYPHAQLQHRNLELQQTRYRLGELDRANQRAMKEIERLKAITVSQGAAIERQRDELQFERSRIEASQEFATIQKNRADAESNRLADECRRHHTTNTVLQNLILTLSKLEVSGRVDGVHLGTLMLGVENRDQEIIELRAEMDMLRIELEEAQNDLQTKQEQ